VALAWEVDLEGGGPDGAFVKSGGFWVEVAARRGSWATSARLGDLLGGGLCWEDGRREWDVVSVHDTILVTQFFE
jgi:hypothetical protein